MNTPLLAILSTLILISHNVMAGSISQCVQPDGTIEFTNKGCSKGKIKRKRRAAFLQPSFVQLQKKLN
ncbi:MAG: hypothetical protein KZQ70_12990 [gamma proteobacterium symbiont of Lucinoma myriamae]|nr:hypothetical protein [gamma proteobacterium symbiont of Lucinoma myriamae]MCU7818373.1 hypothetical protein [gamma proteobacterium symbiont of Lucinoma myriamae]MCU7833210.1 hypothetical protein [gamma proteobacterium symbiont of Lucinoma myriamae]